LAFTNADHLTNDPSSLIDRLRRAVSGDSDTSLTNRLAGTVFAIRVLSAGLAYLVLILLARWMTGSEYGVYVYVWTWVPLLGSVLDFGLSATAQKVIPEYRTDGSVALLRGFLFGSRAIAFVASSIVAVGLAGLVYLLTPWLEPELPAPLYIGCTILPAFVLANMHDGIARSHDWMRLGLMPQYIARQGLLIAFAAGMIGLGMNLSAVAAMVASAIAAWLAMLGQMFILNRRLHHQVVHGPRAYALGDWLKISLPIMMMESFYLLLSYTDILMLQHFRSSEEVGLYFAVVKTLSLVAFIHFSIAATTAHRFTEYFASGNTERLSAYVAYAIKWTFWPSLAATLLLLAVGKPLLWLFGPQFTSGYGIMFVAAIGLIARAAIGPVERLLNMSGHQNTCALTYAFAFLMNVGLCILLVPRYGGYGAAIATSAALVCESILLFILTKRKLGLHVFAFGGRKVS